MIEAGNDNMSAAIKAELEMVKGLLNEQSKMQATVVAMVESVK